MHCNGVGIDTEPMTSLALLLSLSLHCGMLYASLPPFYYHHTVAVDFMQNFVFFLSLTVPGMCCAG